MSQSSLTVTFVGHVDHGKSSVVGRLLVDGGNVSAETIEALRARCAASGKHFEYAFLLDALADEQAQGITIEAARVPFRSSIREYSLIDAPGHIEFIRNMLTGASRADAAVVVIDAIEGLQDNSRRHASLLRFLKTAHVVVLLNKLDASETPEQLFALRKSECEAFFTQLGLSVHAILPVSGRTGEGIVARQFGWCRGPTLLETLDALPEPDTVAIGPLRLFVQDVYKFTRFGDLRRIIAGTLAQGTLCKGMKVNFFPSGKTATVQSILIGSEEREVAIAGEAVGLTVSEQLYIPRGELIADEATPAVSTKFKATLFWLGAVPCSSEQHYQVRIGTAKAVGRIEVVAVQDASSLEMLQTSLSQNTFAEVVVTTSRPLAFDEAGGSVTNRFVVVDAFRIVAAGLITARLDDALGQVRAEVRKREATWFGSAVGTADRVERYGQLPQLVIITGPQAAPRKELGRALEAALFADNRISYFTSMGNLVYDLQAPTAIESDEAIRRLAEVANAMLGAGLLFVVSARELAPLDVQRIRELVGTEHVYCVWYGADVPSDFEYDSQVTSSVEDAVPQLLSQLRSIGVIRGD